MVDERTARARLTQLLDELTASAATLEDESAGGDTSELSRLDQHPAEAASLLSDAEREVAIMEVVQNQRDQVVAALSRLDLGTYGVCVECGRELPEERLEARPEAARCVQCQAKSEHHARPSAPAAPARR